MNLEHKTKLNAPVRIGFYLGRMSGPGSGAWTWLYALLGELVQRKDIEIVVFASEKMQASFNCYSSLSFVVTEQTNAAVSLVRNGFLLNKIVEEHQLDALHLCSLPIPRRLTCKVFYTLHDLRAYYRKEIGGGTSKDIFRKLFYKYMVKRADVIICPSNWAKTDVNEKLSIDLQKILVVPQMLNSLSEKNEDKSTSEQQNYRYVLALGHIEVRKNLETLVRATQSDSWPTDVTLRIVGKDFGHRDKLKEIYQIDPRNSVVFESEVDETQKSNLISRSELVLVPSHIEGFGIVTVEAIMLGVPVLVSDQTALPEVVGTPQAIIEVMNVQKWASRIRDLCANPELRNDLLKTERLALNENSDKKTVDKLLDAYVAKVRS